MLIQAVAMQASSAAHSGSTWTAVASLLVTAVAATVAASAFTDLIPTVLPWLRRRLSRTADAAPSETLEAPSETLEDRLDELSKSMQNSARLVAQVSSELDARTAAVKKLQEDAKTAEALAGLHKEQADAFRRMIDEELAGTARRIRKDSITIGVASFVAGGGVSFAITLFVHPFH
jgi:hypothetical protein